MMRYKRITKQKKQLCNVISYQKCDEPRNEREKSLVALL